MGTRLAELKGNCPLLNCNVDAEKTLGHLQRHWALLQWRLNTLNSRVALSETQWWEIMLRVSSCKKKKKNYLNVLMLSFVLKNLFKEQSICISSAVLTLEFLLSDQEIQGSS